MRVEARAGPALGLLVILAVMMAACLAEDKVNPALTPEKAAECLQVVHPNMPARAREQMAKHLSQPKRQSHAAHDIEAVMRRRWARHVPAVQGSQAQVQDRHHSGPYTSPDRSTDYSDGGYHASPPSNATVEVERNLFFVAYFGKPANTGHVNPKLAGGIYSISARAADFETDDSWSASYTRVVNFIPEAVFLDGPASYPKSVTEWGEMSLRRCFGCGSAINFAFEIGPVPSLPKVETTPTSCTYVGPVCPGDEIGSLVGTVTVKPSIDAVAPYEIGAGPAIGRWVPKHVKVVCEIPRGPGGRLLKV